MKSAIFVLAAGVLLVSTIEELASRQVDGEVLVYVDDRQDVLDASRVRPSLQSARVPCAVSHEPESGARRFVGRPGAPWSTKPREQSADEWLYAFIHDTTASRSAP